MYINFEALSANEIYFQMIQTLVPRPIAWVLSENADQSHNLAPFSYFTAISSDPALLMLSVGKRPEGTPKDTRANIQARKRFVVHIADQSLLDPLNESAASLAAGDSEVEKLGLNTCDFDGFALPRLKDCPIAYACELYDIQEVGPHQQGLIFGEIKQLYLAERVLSADSKGRTKVDAAKLDPLCRLGASEYATLGKVLHKPRPK